MMLKNISKKIFLFLLIMLIFSSLTVSVSGVKVMTFNIKLGTNADKIVQIIKTNNPDVVALQEVVTNLKDSTQKDNYKHILSELNWEGYFSKSISAHGGEYGVAIISKYPFSSQSFAKYNSQQGEKRIYQKVKISLENNDVTIFNTHLSNYEPKARADQIDELYNLASSESGHVVVMGDFNEELDGLSKFTTGMVHPKTKLITYSGSGDNSIDHIFISKSLSFNSLNVDTSKASDHYALIGDISFSKSSGAKVNSCPYTSSAQLSDFSSMFLLGSHKKSIQEKRVNGAFDLFTQGNNFNEILISGGCGAHGTASSNCEAEQMAVLMQNKGVDSKIIFKENKAQSTTSNYKLSKKVQKPSGELVFQQGDRILVVSDHPHVKPVVHCLRYADGFDAYYYQIGTSTKPEFPNPIETSDVEGLKKAYGSRRGMVLGCMKGKQINTCTSDVGSKSAQPTPSTEQKVTPKLSTSLVPKITYIPSFSPIFRESEYSFNPSFSVDIPYDFSIYSKIAESVKEFKKCKADIDCIFEKMNNAEDVVLEQKTGLFNFNYQPDWMAKYAGSIMDSGNKELTGAFGLSSGKFPNWDLYCETIAEDAINSLAEFIDSCKNAPGDNCSCQYDAPDHLVEYADDSEIFISSIPPDKSTTITLSKSIELDKDLFKGEQGFIWDGGDSFSFTASPVIVKDTALYYLPTEDLIDSLATAIGDYVTGQDTDPKPKFMSNFKFTYDKFDSFYLVKDSGALGFYKELPDSDIEECEVDESSVKYVKFCVNTPYTFYAYDSEKEILEEKNVVIRFAETFRSTIPKVSSLNSLSLFGIDRGAIVAWDEILESDIDHYTLFSTSAATANSKKLSKLTPSEIINLFQAGEMGDNSNYFEFNDDNLIILDDIDITKFRCQPSSGLCDVEFWAKQPNLDYAFLEFDKEYTYYVKTGHFYFRFIPNLPKATNWYFGIIGADSDGYTSPDVNSITTSITDSLPPQLVPISIETDITSAKISALEEPILNLDGTTMFETDSYRIDIFCADSPNPNFIPNKNSKNIKLLGTLPADLISPLSHPISVLASCPQPPGETKTYIFGVTFDKKNNAFMGQIPEDLVVEQYLNI